MNTIKHVLSLLFLLSSITVFAQSGYEIYTTTVSEKFNSEEELKSRRIWASGVRNEEVLNLDFTVDAKNTVTELIINEKNVPAVMIKEYKPMIDYVIKYVDGQVENEPAKTTTTTKEPADKDKLTESDKRALMDLIKTELITDKLIDNPDVFDFMLTYDSLYINAKKQDATVFQKYKDLYDKYSDTPLSRTTFFQITQTL